MSRDRDDDLADLLEELADTLRRIESEVSPKRPRRGPFGLPAPPSPGDILRFTGEYAIPTAIAVLKANIKILELLGALLRAGKASDEARQRADETVGELGTKTVSQLERALTQIQRAVEDGNLPQTSEARDVVEEARRLNADLREYVREADESVESERRAERDANRETEQRAERDADGGTTIPIEDRSDESSVEIDVEEELKSIKDGMNEETGDEGDEADDAEGSADGDGGDDGDDGDDEDEPQGDSDKSSSPDSEE